MIRRVNSPEYNYSFDTKTGLFVRWGKTLQDDPVFSPIGPEILDIEISKGGDCLGKCTFCYKQNGTGKTENMTFETFKLIFDNFKSNLTQVAFGIMNLSTNPDMWRMFQYCRENGVIPNYTCHGLDTTDFSAQISKSLCGSVAVSLNNEESTFDSIQKLTNAGISQVNLHIVVWEERLHYLLNVINKIKQDKRCSKLNAVVFLTYKPKGKQQNYSNLTMKSRTILIEKCIQLGLNIGFDSCSAPMAMKILPEYSFMVEPCESGLFSGYINCKGYFFPCSFAEGIGHWTYGLDTKTMSMNEIWHSKLISEWRKSLLEKTCSNCELMQKCRHCPIFNISTCKDERR